MVSASHILLLLALMLVPILAERKCGIVEVTGHASAFMTSSEQDQLLTRGGAADIKSMVLQRGGNKLSVSWTGFLIDRNDPVLVYEWAIVSAESATKYLVDGNRCTDIFGMLPNVKTWESVGTQTSVTTYSLQLDEGYIYRVMVRAIYNSGKVSAVAFSNEIFILGAGEQKPLEHSVHIGKRVLEKRDVDSVIEPSSTCVIDSANRCRQATERVGDLLENLYGPAEWRNVIDPFRSAEEEWLFLQSVTGFIDPSIDTPTPFPRNWKELKQFVDEGELVPYIKNSHDDDDEEASSNTSTPGWVAALLAPIGAAALLLLFLLFLLCFGWRYYETRDEDYAAPAEKEDVPAAAAAYGAVAATDEATTYRQGRGDLKTEASDRTLVEFPETAIRRLSITHQDDVPAGDAEDAASPRRKHPIMQSASSSFRDYRNVNV